MQSGVSERGTILSELSDQLPIGSGGPLLGMDY